MHAEAEKTSRRLSMPIQTHQKHWWAAFTPETFLLIEGIYSSGIKPQF